MNFSINLILGAGLIGYGLYTLAVHHLAPQRFEKLTYLREKYGEKMGFNIHYVGHTIGPLLAGILTLAAHFRAVA